MWQSKKECPLTSPWNWHNSVEGYNGMLTVNWWYRIPEFRLLLPEARELSPFTTANEWLTRLVCRLESSIGDKRFLDSRTYCYQFTGTWFSFVYSYTFPKKYKQHSSGLNISQRMYSCRCAGEELKAKLVITEASLRFNIKLWDRAFEPDKLCVLECQLNKPHANVEWSVDSNIIKNDRRHAMKIQNEACILCSWSQISGKMLV